MGSGSKKAPSFAEIVASTKAAPSTDPAPLRVGHQTNGTFVDRDGHVYSLVEDSIDGARAQAAAADGATIVWDPCGCGGACGFQWIDGTAARRLGSVTPKIADTKRRKGSVGLWQSDKGTTLLLLEDAVSWGNEIG